MLQEKPRGKLKAVHFGENWAAESGGKIISE